MAEPLDGVITAVNIANTRLNGRVETLQPIGGQLVGNTDAFSNQVVNAAWRKLLNRLADLRYSEVEEQQLFTAVPASATTDPAILNYWNWTGYFDGVTLHSGVALPANMIQPYQLQERQTGTTVLLTEMDLILWALPLTPKASWNRKWIWKNGTIFLPGALVSTDIMLTFAQLLPDFTDASLRWFQTTIPLLNAVDALAYYICVEIATARGDAAAASMFQLAAESAAGLMVNRNTASPKSIAKASELYKMSDSRTPVTGPMTKQIER